MNIKKLLLFLLLLVILNALSASALIYNGIAWNATYATGNVDTALGVAADSLNNVFVTGASNNDIVTIKYNSSGNQVWTKTYATGGNDIGRGVAADSANNVIMTGRDGAGIAPYVTIKYNGTSGNQMWLKKSPVSGYGRGIAVDSNDDVLVTGEASSDYLTYKYNGVNGAEIWNATYDGGGLDVARGVAVDSSDNVIVAGLATFGTIDFFIIKYDSSGNQLWNATFDTGTADYTTGVAVDLDDNIIVVGYNQTGGNNDYLIVKYDSAGSQMWNRTANRAAFDLAAGVAVDYGNNIFVTGYSGNVLYDYFTPVFDTYGNYLMNITFSSQDDLAQAVAVDALNNVLVTGYSNLSGNDDYLTFKYNFTLASCPQTINASTVLVQDLTSAGSCLRIDTGNITLDCAGRSITGSQVANTYGVKFDYVSNVALVHCNVRNFSFGLLSDHSNFSYVFNNTFDNNRPGVGGTGYGVYVNYSNNSTFYRNIVNRSDADGIRIRESAGNNFTENIIDLNDDWGIFMFRNCQNSFFIRNNITRTQFFSAMGSANLGNNFNLIAFNKIFNGRGGANFFHFNNNNITQNQFFDNVGGVILQAGVRDNVVSKNIFRNTTGLSVDGNNNTIINNTAYNGKGTGQFGAGGGAGLIPNTFINNKAFNNSGNGFFSVNDFNNNYYGNIAYDNNGIGFYISVSGSNIQVINNTAYNNTGNGFYFDSFFGANIVRNNTAYGNNMSGMVFFMCSGANATDNSLRDNNLYGFLMNSSSLLNVTLNTVLNHTLSINLFNSDNNRIYNNYFDDEPLADAASTGNSWNIAKTAGTNIIGGPFLGGNYWRTYNGTDTDGDGLGDTNIPWKGLFSGIVNGGDSHPLVYIYVKNIQCEFNNSGIFLNCNNATFYANITRVRVNCTSLNGIVSNATFNLTNLFDANTFFVNTTSNVIGGYYVLDNTDVQILDSGNWTLKAACANTSGARRNGTAPFFIPFGNISVSMIAPPGSTNVTNGSNLSVTCRMACSGGECVNVTLTLDPINPFTNLTQPTRPVHAVYADSQFIYGASEDNLVYVWNKTGLALFAIINTSMPNRDVFADSQYIYAVGVWGVNGNLTVWNRTDLATPFASVANISFPGGVYGVKSDNNYIYAAGGFGGGPGRITVYNKSTFASLVNLTFNDLVRDIDIDSNAIYSVSHACEVNVTNITGFAPVAGLPVPAACNQVKAVSVDNDYILVSGFLSFFPQVAWARVYNKSNYAVLFDWNDTRLPSQGLAAEVGGLDFAYFGGLIGGFLRNGTILQLNKTSFAVNDSITVINWTIKGLYCDAAYLYAAAEEFNIWDGMVMLFNNPCPGLNPLTINSITIHPSQIPVPSVNVTCSANVTTTAGVIDTVLFNITFPNGSSILLPSTNVSSVYNSSPFNVTVAGLHICNVIANNTNGTAASRSRNFYGGQKGAVPMNSGSPFYTNDQNPRGPAHQACLNSTLPGTNCDSSWNATANGTIGQTWQFFCMYESTQSGDANTSRINVTILGGPPPPPGQPNMTINKSGSPNPVFVGNIITYTINYSNIGNGTAYNVTVIEIYDGNVTYVSAIPAPDFGTNDTWTIGSVASNVTGAITVRVRVNAGVANNTNITNRVNITYQNAAGANFSANDTEITLALTPPPIPPKPRGGGGGGSAARNWQQLQEEVQEEAVCVESWFCDAWSECELGQKIRTCIDLNACGTAERKPAEIADCSMPVVEKPAVVEQLDVEEITKEEPGPAVIVESHEENKLSSLLTSRNVVRAALLVVVIAALVYVFYLARFLRKRKIVSKGVRLKDEDFKAEPKKAAPAPVMVKKAASEPKAKPVAEPKKAALKPKKPVEKLPEDTKGLLKELDKL